MSAAYAEGSTDRGATCAKGTRASKRLTHKHGSDGHGQDGHVDAIRSETSEVCERAKEPCNEATSEQKATHGDRCSPRPCWHDATI